MVNLNKLPIVILFLFAMIFCSDYYKNQVT